MTRRLLTVVLMLACLLLCAGRLAHAAESVLKLVPKGALGFAVLNRLAMTDAKLQELGRQMQLPIPSLLSKIAGEGGVRAGLDQQGTIAVLVLPPQSGDVMPTPILLLPVTDYGKFLAPFHPENATEEVVKIKLFGAESWVRSIGGYAAVANGSHREILQKDLKLAKQVPAALAPLQAWLAENDAAVVILAPGIKLLSLKVQEGIRMVKSTLAQRGQDTEQAAAGLDIYAKLFRAAEKEVSASAVAVQWDGKSGLRLTKRARLVSGGSWSRFAAQVPSAKENPLAGLPAGPFVFAAGGEVSEAAWAAMMKFSIEMMQAMPKLYGLSEEQVKKMPGLMGASVEAMKAVRSMAIVLGAGQRDESLYSNMVATMRVDNAPAYLVDYEKAMKQYGEFVKELKSPMLPPPEVQKTEVAGKPALQITMKLPPMLGDKQPQYGRIMETMFGPEGKLVGWLAPAGEHTVIMGYTNKRAVERAIQAVQQGAPGLAGDADVRKTAALLPPGAPWVAYWSPRGTIDLVNRMVPAVAPPGTKVEFQLPEFPKTPPIGCAVTAAPDELRSYLVVPPEVLRAIGQYIGKVKPATKTPAGKGVEKKPNASGKITLDGKPLTGAARIEFAPTGKGKPRGFQIKDGQFEGALKPGRYTLGIRGPGVPQKYHQGGTSGLTVEIKEGSNQFDFNLRSD